MFNSDFSINDFDYHLPLELIAQEPATHRDSCRLLALKKNSGEISHHLFSDIKDFLNCGDVLVLNESKVFPARLIGHKKDSGGEVEVFLHRKIENSNNVWEALIRGRVKVGLKIVFSLGLEAEIIQKEEGTCLVSFNVSTTKLFALLNKIGLIPLPPYIKRDDGVVKVDKRNYQTVFASKEKVGSVAAPTAGLHFTSSLLKELEARGVEIVKITLHVGLGTFAPVKVNNIQDHKMHSEFVSIEKTEADKLVKAKKEGRRIVPVGTTACRAIESFAAGFASYNPLKEKSPFKDISFWTNIFIYPGFKFILTDALITNFHLPKSTLLMLISALAGKENIDMAYNEAIREKYRFFSYGDAMFIY